ncbi:MAG: ABC transporter ATP-binding protein/permease [Lachnospiraceae bacterium]|nr:ABC transporter ATP-binding protein/permease [Lachnospiraceae bacterium]
MNSKYPKTRFGWLWENMRGHRVTFILSIIGTIVYSSMQLVVPYFSGRIVDGFLSANAPYTIAENRDIFFKMLILMIGLTLFRVIVVYLDCMGYERVSQSVLSSIRNFLYDKIQRQDMTFYGKYRTGDLMTRMTGDLDAVRHNIAWVVRAVIESITLFGACAIYFVIMDVRLALSILLIAPFILILIVFFKRKVAPFHAALREKFAHMNTDAQENISGNRVVKAFAAEDHEIEKFDGVNTDYKDTNMATNMIWLQFFPYVETCANILPVVLLLVGGIFIINGSLTMGEYVSFSGLMWAVAVPMRLLGNIMNEFQRFAAASDKVMEIYYSEPGIKDLPDAIDHPERFKGKIEFQNVSFRYLDGYVNVLNDISFVAEPGQTIAIMGETGCGKTSLIQMIPRFYEPTGGHILIDDVDIRKYKLSDLRKNIGLATQDVLLYSDSIEGNIAYGVAHMSLDQIIKFAKYSAASDFISKMPEGYDTIIGERGVGLSGGQKQRISLARALAVEPSILILDDTTSAVDMETEKEIQHSLRNLDFECTKIIIAQRISTTKFADRILVLKNGSIAEDGTHEELIRKKGYYYELVCLQTGEVI